MERPHCLEKIRVIKHPEGRNAPLYIVQYWLKNCNDTITLWVCPVEKYVRLNTIHFSKHAHSHYTWNLAVVLQYVASDMEVFERCFQDEMITSAINYVESLNED